ncbi:hypothetical protein GIB67_005357 [Kingdonia uniflora]|uniref:DUF4283 domain-containing protein n=1 Tax=Kingdonia uniflora TaxID=39325 RepID=A0A7J7NDN6_9MAGN|nr:hypothetical protein GIB67_005357 [Kingdonia uniflora]
MKFPMGRPKADVIESNINSNWGLLEKPTTVAVLDFKHMMVMMKSEKDVTKALIRESRQIKGFFFKLFRWSIHFDPLKESPITPVWIQFLGLKLCFQNNGILKQLAGLMGKYLDTDSATLNLSRPSTARVCIEVDLSTDLLQKLYLSNKKCCMKICLGFVHTAAFRGIATPIALGCNLL